MTTAFGATTPLLSTPYLTLQEFKNAPTAVKYDNLVPGGTPDQQDAELANLIARASSWMDTYCYQVLAATTQTEQMRCRLGSDGTLRLFPRYFPIREVSAVGMGASPDTVTALTLGTNVWVQDRAIDISQASGSLGSDLSGMPRPGGWVYITVTYVAGFPNTVLTAEVTGAVSLPVKDATGILPGDYIGVYDDTNGIQMPQVADTWVPTTGPANVPVTSNVTAADGIAVSALPPAIKQACIYVTTSLLKSRGSSAIQLATTTKVGTVVPQDPAGPDMARAKELLADFRRVR